jgi:3-phosphoshikimate 1-carboxyvinyltransferase
VATRAHTEEMLARAGADIEITESARGRRILLRRSHLRAEAWSVPGDPSQAAFWVVGAAVVPGSRITIPDLHLGAERIGFLGVLWRMGADIEVEEQDGTGAITSRYAPLTGTVVQAEEIPCFLFGGGRPPPPPASHDSATWGSFE